MKLKKIPLYCKTLTYGLKNPAQIHREILFRFLPSKLEKKELYSLVDPKCAVTLSNYASRDGNVSEFELLAIAHFVASFQPRILLELGTFDGNTTLQMALNSPLDARIHTLDLPESCTEAYLDPFELKYVQDKKKKERKFLETHVSKKICQHLGDSTSYDFKLFGNPDLIFIDASHSYVCVKSDTENALKILNKGGIILWHDFTPQWMGVWRYLQELAHVLPLIHIKNSSLVFYKSNL